jgi:hypothetical protein
MTKVCIRRIINRSDNEFVLVALDGGRSNESPKDESPAIKSPTRKRTGNTRPGTGHYKDSGADDRAKANTDSVEVSDLASVGRVPERPRHSVAASSL